jgi:hypothetical protein
LFSFLASLLARRKEKDIGPFCRFFDSSKEDEGIQEPLPEVSIVKEESEEGGEEFISVA